MLQKYLTTANLTTCPVKLNKLIIHLLPAAVRAALVYSHILSLMCSFNSQVGLEIV